MNSWFTRFVQRLCDTNELTKSDKCSHCGGAGTIILTFLGDKNLCIKCLGTGKCK